jgi:hypothetical protein
MGFGANRMSEGVRHTRQRARYVYADRREDADRSEGDEQQDERILDQCLASVVSGNCP